MESIVDQKVEDLGVKNEEKNVAEKYIEELIDDVVKKNIENFNKKKTILCKDPLIYTLDDYLTDEECDHFINLSKNKLQRAKVSDNKGGFISKGRSGSNFWISHNFDNATTEIGRKIANEVTHPLENAERFQIIHYDETQEYRRHYDSWDHDYSEKALRCLKYGGARLLTALCYLNDVEEGGGTNFPRLKLTVEAKKGRIVVFENTLKDSHDKHPLSEHAGMPVLKGEKYAFNLWFRECKSNMLYKTYNPKYYKKGEPIVRKRIQEKLKEANVELKEKNNVSKSQVIRHYKLKETMDKSIENLSNNIFNIKFKNDFITKEIKENILNGITFDENKTKESHWIQTNKLNNLTEKLENLLKIPREFYESYNLIKYNANTSHKKFFDAWDLESERGIKYYNPRGQRIYSVILFLTPNIEFNFNRIKLKHNAEENSVLIYKNTILGSNQRNKQLIKSIKNNNNESGLLLNLYIREKSRKNKWLFDDEKYVDIEFTNENITLEIKEKDNDKKEKPIEEKVDAIVEEKPIEEKVDAIVEEKPIEEKVDAIVEEKPIEEKVDAIVEEENMV